jgi:glycosyltransferase involved in cell wall biosynthesis
MFLDVLIAWFCGVKIRITHCHSTSCKYRFLHYVFKPFLNILATDRVACSKAAGKWLYGRRSFNIVQNGINFDDYKFSISNREYIHKKHGLTDELVLCHVGYFLDMKNHTFLIDIFKEVTKIEPKSVLILIGSGPLESEIKNKVLALGLEDKVIFTGNTTEVSKYYSASDVFVLPSKFEGLPLVLMEAQVSGLSCFIADNITGEADITGNVIPLSIQSEPGIWAGRITSVSVNSMRDKVKYNERAEMLDIRQSSMELEKFYAKRVNEEYAQNE